MKELFDNGALSLGNLARGLAGLEPSCSIHLGKFLHPTGLRRPRHRKIIAFKVAWIEIAFHRPGKNQFAAGLLEIAELNECTSWKKTRLFLKFPFGRSQRAFVSFN
jgi:hypothetical protein